MIVASLFLACTPTVTRTHVPEADTTAVLANGLRFQVLESGEGPLVLFLHGFPDTAHTWDAALSVAANAGHHGVAPFMRGYTPTEIPAQDPSHEDLAADVIALIDAYGAPRAKLVAHDWGAAAAYAAAAAAPDRIESMMVVAIPPPHTLEPSLRLLWSGRHFLSLRQPTARALMQRNDFAHVDTLTHRWAPSWAFTEADLQPVKNAFAMQESLDAALGYYRGIGLDDSFFVAPIPVPVTMVAGDEDLIPTTAFTEDGSAGVSATYRAEIVAGTGHFVHREDPHAFAALLRAFLAR